MVRVLAEGYDIKSNVKLSGFRCQLQAPYVSSPTEEFWYNEKVCQWMTIYIYIYIYIYSQSAGAVEYTDCFSAEG